MIIPFEVRLVISLLDVQVRHSWKSLSSMMALQRAPKDHGKADEKHSAMHVA